MVVSGVKVCIPIRSVIWVMIFICLWFFYMMRLNLSIIILAMVEPSTNTDNTTAIPECTRNSLAVSNNTIYIEEQTIVPDYGVRYPWDTKLQGVLLGAYFYGFILTGLPGGFLTERYGPRKCILVSFILSGILTAATPWMASIHYWTLIVSRFLIGAIGGVVYPSMFYLIARYAPPDEKGMFSAALMGNCLGTVVSWPMLGSIIEQFGWPWAFYSCGIMVGIFVVLFMILVYDSPEDHPYMSQSEKKFIVDSLSKNVKKKVEKFPPYLQIAKSVPFWALVVLHFGNLWGLFFLATAGPNYMSTVLGFTLGHTGFLASLPYLARAIFGFIFGIIGDIVIRKKLMTKTTTRKFFVIFSHILPAVFLLIETLVGCDSTWVVILLTMSLGMNGATTITSLHNPQDLSPNYAPTIYGIVNSIASTTGFINPLIVGYLTAEHNGLAEWKKIFYTGTSVYVGCAAVFVIFGNAEIQSWNGMDSEEIKNDIDADSLEMTSETNGIKFVNKN